MLVLKALFTLKRAFFVLQNNASWTATFIYRVFWNRGAIATQVLYS